MKPKHLKRPFKWEERTPLLQDGVFFVPEYYARYEEFTFPHWENLFGNLKPVRIEYCSGNGAWITSCASADPMSNWVAIEKRFDRVQKIWSKMKNNNLENLLAISGEGLLVTKQYFKSESVDEIFINFPDPWPKRKHAKNRIVQKPFVDEMYRILKKKGKVTIVTDDPDYSEIISQEMCPSNRFAPNFPKPHYVHELANYGTSYFEELWRSKGKSIRYHCFTKMDVLNGNCN